MPTITLKDGRILAYESFGDTTSSGTRVIFSHGLADSRLLKHWDDKLTESLGVHIITIDQPGVGDSTDIAIERRTLKQYAEDVKELAIHLRWTDFYVAGHSGGGPHALALASYLGPDIVKGGALAAPAPPFDYPMDPNDSEGDIWHNFEIGGPTLMRVFVQICRWFPILVTIICKIFVWYGNYDISAYTVAVAKSDRTDGIPETFLGDKRQTEVFEKSFKEGIKQGVCGLYGMFQVCMLAEFGFDIRTDIDKSQHFDIFVSQEDAAFKPHLGKLWCTALPSANWHLWKNSGHYSFVDRNNWVDFWTKIKEKENR